MVTEVVSIFGALLLAFIAYKVLIGFVRIGVIILILVVLAALFNQGVIG